MSDSVLSTIDQNAVTRSRLNSSLGEYEQTVAVCQDAVNAGLSTRWRSEQIKWKTRSVDITGTMLSPTVEFLNTQSRHEGRFWINLGSFTFSLWSMNEDHTVTPTNHSFANWSLCYDVNFSQEQLDAKDVPQEVKDVWGNPDTYTAWQIMLDFSSTNFLSPNAKLSRTPGIDAPDFDEQLRKDLRNGLISFLEDWVEGNIKRKNNILSYNAVDKLQHFPAPSIPAKKTTFQTYPFYSDGNASSGHLIPGFTAFVFASMLTPGSDFPKTDAGVIKTIDFSGDLLLPFKRDKAQDDSKQAGSIRMNGDLFWKQIEPDLLAIAKCFYFTPDFVKTHADLTLDNVYFQFATGFGSPTGLTGLTKSGREYVTTYKDSKKDSDSAGRFDTSETWANLETDGKTTFSWEPNSNIISVSGSSHVIATYQQKVAAWWGTCSIRMGWKWEYKLGLETDKAGRLSFSIVKDSWTHTKDPENDEADIKTGYTRPNIDDFARSLTTVRLSSPVQALASMVAGHKAFVLPAAGQWWMQSPVFAENGDVLIGLTLKIDNKPI